MKREPIALSEHFDYKKLFRFVLPSVVMCVFTQVYGVVDGLFASSFFTALNNGAVSASISFLRTLLFQCGAVLVLPLILGTDGIWLSVVAAEILSLVVSAGFFIGMRKKYRY